MNYPTRERAGGNVVGEALDVLLDEGGHVFGGVGDEGGKVDAEGEAESLVDAVGFEVGGVGAAAAQTGQVVALAAGDLRVEDSQQGGLQVFVGGQVEVDFIAVQQPIQIAPDFAAVEFLRPFGGGQAADGGNRPADKRLHGCRVCRRGYACRHNLGWVALKQS